MKNLIIVIFAFIVGVAFFAWHLSGQKEQARERKKQSIERFQTEPTEDSIKTPPKPVPVVPVEEEAEGE